MAPLRLCAALLVALCPASALAEEVSGFCDDGGAPRWRRFIGRTPAAVRDEIGPPDSQSRSAVVYRSVRCGTMEGPGTIWSVTLHLGPGARIVRITQRQVSRFVCRHYE